MQALTSGDEQIEKNTARRNNNLDMLKGICCMCVVLLHFNWANKVGLCVRTITRVAVPTFFFISGFFCLTNNKIVGFEAFSRKIVRTVALIRKAWFGYLLVYLIYHSFNNPNWKLIASLQPHITGYRIQSLVITNSPVFFSHLWFLFALIYCYCLLSVFSGRQFFLIPTLIVAIILIVCLSTLTEFNVVIHLPFLDSLRKRNMYPQHFFLFRALPFVLLGMVAKHIMDHDREGAQSCVVRFLTLPFEHVYLCMGMVAAGLVTSIFERFRCDKECQCYLGTILADAFIWGMVLKHKEWNAPILIHTGKDLSSDVYLWHVAAGYFVGLFASRLRGLQFTVYVHILPFLVLAMSLLIAEALYRIKKMRSRVQGSGRSLP